MRASQQHSRAAGSLLSAIKTCRNRGQNLSYASVATAGRYRKMERWNVYKNHQSSASDPQFALSSNSPRA